MQENYAKIQEEDAEIIAISVDTIALTKQTVENEGLEVPVLSDEELKAIIAYNVEDQEFPRYARPATFIIEPDGTIAWVSLDTVNERVPIAKILIELGKLW